jgi:hypothetical protein
MTAAYDRQPRESLKAHNALLAYLQLSDERSHAKVAKQLGKSIQLISRWSRRWNWVERSIAWDRMMEEKERERMIRERNLMAKRHARIGVMGLTLAVKALEKLDPSQLGPAGTARLLAESARIERMARGSNEEDGGFATVVINVQHRHPRADDPPKAFPLSKFRGGETA